MSESPAVYSKLNLKARKEHKCCECGGFIPKGEHYFKHLCCYSGYGWRTFKNCFVCEEIRIACDERRRRDDPVCFYTLREEVVEVGGHLYVKFMTNRHGRGKPMNEEQMERAMQEALL
jgi:hypothetical protein